MHPDSPEMAELRRAQAEDRASSAEDRDLALRLGGAGERSALQASSEQR